MTPVKIAISGAHSTGKTTFLTSMKTELHKRGIQASVVQDLATEAARLGFPILQDHTYSSTLWIVCRGITAELEACLNHEIVLVDRPVADALGYFCAAHAARSEVPNQDELSRLASLAASHSTSYDITFKTVLDPAEPILADGRRDTDPEFRLLVDRCIDRALNESGITPRNLKRDEVERCLSETVEELELIVCRLRGAS